MVTKEPKGREVNDGDSFSFNQGFSEKLYRIKINSIQLKETVEENNKTNEQVMQDRQYQVRARGPCGLGRFRDIRVQCFESWVQGAAFGISHHAMCQCCHDSCEDKRVHFYSPSSCTGLGSRMTAQLLRSTWAESNSA